MKLMIQNPVLPYNLNETGATDLLQTYLQSKVECWIGFCMDFSANTLEIDTDVDVEPSLFSEFGTVEVMIDVQEG